MVLRCFASFVIVLGSLAGPSVVAPLRGAQPQAAPQPHVGAQVSVGQRAMNGVASLHTASTLPQFGGVADSQAAPTLPPTDDRFDDSCPDDIWIHAVQYEPPVLPYRTIDDYDRGGAQQVPGNLKTVTLENDRYRATVYPKVGGKLGSLFDKREGRELLFDNPVFQPAALGRLNAWTSGGIEWNWPRHGHSVFTMMPVFVAEVESDRGPIVRIYEFDREMNSTWQVDLFLPDGSEALYIHTKLTNTNPWPIDGYWWTNIGLSIDESSRTLYPSDYAIYDRAARGLYRGGFPMVNDNSGTSGNAVIGDPDLLATDHSYPINYYNSRETFLRKDQPSAREWMGLVNVSDGLGFLHAQTSELNGRKYWAWGNDPADTNRMNFLSVCNPDHDTRSHSATACAGWYLEEQAGVAPTQEQTFPLSPHQSLQFTEAVLPFRMPPSAAAAADYNEALHGAEGKLDEALPEAAFLEVDAWLRSSADLPVTRILSHGSGFGSLHETLIGQHLSSGLTFSVPETGVDGPWRELLADGTFSAQTLAEPAPQSFMVDRAWVAAIERSGEAHGWTYLHRLHLHIAYKQLGDAEAAADHLRASLALNSDTNVLGLFLADRKADALAAALSAAADPLDGHAVDVARDVFTAVLDADRESGDAEAVGARLASIDALPTEVQAALKRAQPTRLAAAWHAVHGDSNPSKALEMLSSPTWAVSNPALLDLWADAQYAVKESQLGRKLSTLERVQTRRANPPPACIDFRGAV